MQFACILRFITWRLPKQTVSPFSNAAHHLVTCDLQLLWQWFSKYSLEIIWKSFNAWKLFNLIYSCLSREFKAKKKDYPMCWLQMISMTESLQLCKQKLLWELLTFTKSSRNQISCDLGFGVWMLRAVGPCRWHFFIPWRVLTLWGKLSVKFIKISVWFQMFHKLGHSTSV